MSSVTIVVKEQSILMYSNSQKAIYTINTDNLEKRVRGSERDSLIMLCCCRLKAALCYEMNYCLSYENCYRSFSARVETYYVLLYVLR